MCRSRNGEAGIRRLIALTVVLVVGLVGCSTNSEPTATYTGGACDYDGPSEFDINTTVTFAVTNESDTTDVGFVVLDFPEDVTSEEILEQGIVEFVTFGEFASAVRAPTAIGESEDLSVFFDTPGQWGLNCYDKSGGEHNGDGLDYVTMFTVNR